MQRARTQRPRHAHDVSLRSRACTYFRCRGPRNTRVDEAPRLFSRYHHLGHVSTGHYGLIISITPHADRSYSHNRRGAHISLFLSPGLPRGSAKNTPTLQLDPLILTRDAALNISRLHSTLGSLLSRKRRRKRFSIFFPLKEQLHYVPLVIRSRSAPFHATFRIPGEIRRKIRRTLIRVPIYIYFASTLRAAVVLSI